MYVICPYIYIYINVYTHAQTLILVNLVVVNVFVFVTLLEMAPPVSGNIWTHDIRIVPLTSEYKMGPYSDQGMSNLRVLHVNAKQQQNNAFDRVCINFLFLVIVVAICLCIRGCMVCFSCADTDSPYTKLCIFHHLPPTANRPLKKI